MDFTGPLSMEGASSGRVGRQRPLPVAEQEWQDSRIPLFHLPNEAVSKARQECAGTPPLAKGRPPLSQLSSPNTAVPLGHVLHPAVGAQKPPLGKGTLSPSLPPSLRAVLLRHYRPETASRCQDS